MTTSLNVKSGISAPVVTSIPKEWDAQWFRRFITNYLQNADIRNTPGIVGATFANPPTTTVIATAVAQFTATSAGTVPASGGNPLDFLSANGEWIVPAGVLPTIANNTVLGNVSGGAAQPVAISKTQLTTLVNVFTSALSGAVPASGGGTTEFLRADTTFAVPNYPIVPTSANPSAQVGPTAVNGTALTFMTSDSAPAINAGAAYTWGGVNTYNARVAAAAGLTVTNASFISRGITDNATATALTLAATGAVSIAAPSSANVAVTVNGANSSIGMVLISGLSGTTSGADQNIRRAGSTANQIQQGASLDLSDSTATTASSIQHSGGQFELWMTQNNGVTWTQALKVLTSNGVVIGTPTSGDTLTLSPSATSGALIATSAALTNNAGALVGTLTNAPATGNPTKWIKINDNGTIRSIPAW